MRLAVFGATGATGSMRTGYLGRGSIGTKISRADFAAFLLAQTRQADRDKALADADAQHREALAGASIERQELAAKQAAQMFELLQQNTKLTQITQELAERIKELTDQIHQKVTQ